MWPARSITVVGSSLVEMIEDARLVPAEQPLALRIADVARVAGEIDPRIQGHDRGHRLADLVPYHLLWLNNIYYRKLLQTRKV